MADRAEKDNYSKVQERYSGLTPEQKATWLITQADVIRAREEEARTAAAAVTEAQLALARFTAMHTSPDVWALLPSHVADEVTECFPDGAGYFGLDPEEGQELARLWEERTGVKYPHSGIG
jgi:hypothetical protein